MSLLVGEYIKLLVGLRRQKFTMGCIFSQLIVEFYLLEGLLLGSLLKFFCHHMPILANVDGLLLFLVFQLVSDRRYHSLLKEHFGGHGVLVLDGFGH